MEFWRVHLGSDRGASGVLCWSIGSAMHGVSVYAEDGDLILHGGGVVHSVRGSVGAVWC